MIMESGVPFQKKSFKVSHLNVKEDERWRMFACLMLFFSLLACLDACLASREVAGSCTLFSVSVCGRRDN